MSSNLFFFTDKMICKIWKFCPERFSIVTPKPEPKQTRTTTKLPDMKFIDFLKKLKKFQEDKKKQEREKEIVAQKHKAKKYPNDMIHLFRARDFF